MQRLALFGPTRLFIWQRVPCIYFTFALVLFNFTCPQPKHGLSLLLSVSQYSVIRQSVLWVLMIRKDVTLRNGNESKKKA